MENEHEDGGDALDTEMAIAASADRCRRALLDYMLAMSQRINSTTSFCRRHQYGDGPLQSVAEELERLVKRVIDPPY